MQEVDAPIGLEGPHVEVAAQLADGVDANHFAERLELVEVRMHLTRRRQELAGERACEVALADARRPVEEVGVRRPFYEGGGEEALRLRLLAKGLEGGPGHGRGPRVHRPLRRAPA